MYFMKKNLYLNVYISKYVLFLSIQTQLIKKKLYNIFIITKKKGKGLKIHIIIDLLKIFYHKFKNEQKNDNFYLIID